MATRALPPGTVQRRAFFGLLDADGWPAAFVKALFWFGLIIFLLGYIPDRAYYFTVFPTIDVGTNVISPINFCDGANRTLPCPAPGGAVVPWETSPQQLALPEGRSEAATVQSGTHLYLIGGRTGSGATDSVLVTDVTTDGNYGPWQQGPKLPAPRSNAAVVPFNGVPYVIGGLGADGKPTDTVFVGVLEAGALTGWKAGDDASLKLPAPLKLPTPLSDASAVAGAGGLWVIGGRDASGISARVYRASVDATVKLAALGRFVEAPSLALRYATGDLAPRANALAVLVGNALFVVGGNAPQGVAAHVFRLSLDAKGEPLLDSQHRLIGWGEALGAAVLPAARADASGFVANGTIYIPGGRDASGAPTRTLYWAQPDSLSGNIAGWQHLDATDLPAATAGGAAAPVGSFAFLFGGDGGSGPTAGALRADLAPRAPFLRLGLIGATVPALSIKGEIGQQLGYLNAALVGGLDFTILILIGLAYSHRRQTQRLLERFSRGRYRAPREDEYFE